MGNICDIRFLGKKEEQSCYVENMTVFYVIKGKASFKKKDGEKVELQEEDIIAINPPEQVKLCTQGSIVAAIEFHREEIYRLLKGRIRTVDCCSVNVRNGSFNQIRDKIKSLLSAKFNDDFGDVVFEKTSFELLIILFSEYSKEEAVGDRKAEVLGWIENSYKESITLESAAEQFHLTPQYFSSWFTETFGISFLKYLSQVRCRNAQRALITGNETILKIALDNGFPNSTSFSNSFSSIYGCSPVEYRKKYTTATDEEDISREEMEEYIESTKEYGNAVDEIHVDCSDYTRLLNPYWKRLCNVSGMNGLADYEIQNQLTELQKGISFDYVRVAIESFRNYEETGFYKEDRAIEYLLETGMKVIFTIDYRECKHEKEFYNRIYEFSRHIIHRYGFRCIMIELVYDTIYTKKKAEEYKHYIDGIRKVIRELNVECKLYGPCLLINRDGSNLKSFLNVCADIDAITINCAPFEITDNDNIVVRRVTDSDFMLHQYELASEIVKSNGLSIPILITRWKNSFTGFDVLNDSSWAAAHIVRSAFKGYGILSSLPLDDPLDLLQVDSSKQKLFYGASGLMTVGKLRKPSFYAYQFLSHLDERYLYHNEHMMVTGTGGDYFQILLQNCSQLSYRYYMDNQTDKEQIPDDYFENKNRYEIKLLLEGLPNGKWFVKSRIINETEGNVYNSWLSMNYEDMSFWGKDEMKMLEASSFPRMEGMILETTNGILELPITMEANEIRHLHLIPIR
ncbi:MAG: helix-turn-helix domain-containing protein [Pseudobutyrivibrio sp.]|nr:helix-turn-helix domain-containing protein [Pseudobutyrivibrio sp.]